MVSRFGLVQDGSAVIRRCQLVGRHAAEERIGPASLLSCLFLILQHLLSCAASGCRIVAVEYAPVNVGRHKIDKGNDGKQHNSHHIGQAFLPCFHNQTICVYTFSHKVRYFFA